VRGKDTGWRDREGENDRERDVSCSVSCDPVCGVVQVPWTLRISWPRHR
jgi:hypothetical protein